MCNKIIKLITLFLISYSISKDIIADNCNDCTSSGSFWCGVSERPHTPVCSTTTSNKFSWCTSSPSSCQCLGITLGSNPCSSCLSKGCSYCGTKAINPLRNNLNTYYTCFDENVKFMKPCNSTVSAKGSCKVDVTKSARDCFSDKIFYHNIDISPYLLFTVNSDGTLVENTVGDIVPTVTVCNATNIRVNPMNKAYEGPGIYSVDFKASGYDQVDLCHIVSKINNFEFASCDVIVEKGSSCGGLCRDSNDCTTGCNQCVNQMCR